MSYEKENIPQSVGLANMQPSMPTVGQRIELQILELDKRVRDLERLKQLLAQNPDQAEMLNLASKLNLLATY